MEVGEIKKILKKIEASPRRSMGQNFLLSDIVLEKITKEAEISPQDKVLEIGPGLGFLTEKLLKKGASVWAVEKDKKFADYLRNKFCEEKKLKIIREDILEENLGLDIGGDYKVVSNLPYNITYPTIKKFLTKKRGPQLMGLLVQEEVARRICSSPPNMSKPAVLTQIFSKAKISFIVSRHLFYPSPKVRSAFLLLVSRNINLDYNKIAKFVEAGFSQKRKKLAKNLERELGLSKEKVSLLLKNAGLVPNQRAEEVLLEKWVKLAFDKR